MVSRKNHAGRGGATNAFGVPPNEVGFSGLAEIPAGLPRTVLMNRPVRIGAVVCSDGSERVAFRFSIRSFDPLDLRF